MKKCCPICQKEFEYNHGRVRYCEDCRGTRAASRFWYQEKRATGWHPTKVDRERANANYKEWRKAHLEEARRRGRTNAQKYRAKLKVDPERWAEHLRKCREQQRKRRQQPGVIERKRLAREQYLEANSLIKQCEICHREFRTMRKRQKLCGDPNCKRLKHNREVAEYEARKLLEKHQAQRCLWCGGSLPKYHKKYCSEACRIMHLEKRNAEKTSEKIC